MLKRILPVLVFSTLIVTSYPLSAQDSLRRPVMQLEIEEVILEEPGTTDEDFDYVIETPTPTPEPAVFSILSEAEREEFEMKGTVIRRTLPYSEKPLIMGTGFAPSDYVFTEKKPSTPVEQEGTYSLFANQPYSFQTVAIQLDYLKTLTGASIPSVSCDVSATGCTYVSAGSWELAQTYGLGYRVGTSTLYRPFPVRTADQPASVVMSDSYRIQPMDIPLYMKLNLPPSFQEGTYASEILLITLPKP